MKKSAVWGHATVTMHRLRGVIGGLFGFACLVGSQLTTTSIVMTPADFNCSSVNTTECMVCPAGTYPDNDTEFCQCCSNASCVNSSHCLPCQFGYYQPHSGQADCLPCPQGFYTNTSKSEVCQSCQPGSFSNASASVLCTSCEKGFFSSIQNATQCQPCTPGSFCNTSSCTSCALCPAGEEAVNSGSADCTPCSPGMYKGPKDPRCLHCRDGEYQAESGADRCNVCPIDHYCPSPDIGPITCPEDAFCPAGSTEPSYCMETFLRKSGDSCEMAPLTIVLLVVCAAVLLFAVIYVVRKHRMAEQRQPMTAFTPKSPLLKSQRSSSSIYGLDYDAEPVYAGW
ncbi:tumor necrosis factor receptor superfamily member 9-like [Rana temporaria]|uniref:tumor necrosis factor receptor superfamily member 9-like n=1 Tax=Rana temporaria TaxID=8407 RepID=UPI001AACC503|nr:tumor necrosis factor receptor superfamily member 9-like [Rana temporaria]